MSAGKREGRARILTTVTDERITYFGARLYCPFYLGMMLLRGRRSGGMRWPADGFRTCPALSPD